MSESKRKFQADLALGEKGERHVATKLKKHYKANSISKTGAGKGYDFRLMFDNCAHLIEVKTDLKAKTTGNLFFEYQCNDKPSGLTSTQADKWAILLPHLQLILCFEPKEMLCFLQASSQAREVIGGDRRAVRGYVISIENVKKLKGIEQISTNTRIKHEQ